ncbi:FecR domain-containing protein [Sphingomonas sp.]|uniref:FecR family protein n=1 Tax=Sphingomonas sp. TaxID=28214 RepID=UPI000DB3D872|nr:FecR domain-containing protein [Sphingomonas sp.]PZU09748.1 MAG: hypothetical protein DI605_08900 [Sphingomonas sp.]
MSARPDMDERMLDQAIAWHQALARDDADWDAYLGWLEADPRHREAYDEVALLDRMADDHAPTLKGLGFGAEGPPPGERAEPRAWRRRGWLVGGLAAAIAVAVAVPVLNRQAPADIVYGTGAGETRHVALGGGTAVDLAPSSRLVALNGDPARLELARGEAYFVVAHDPARTLSIRSGDYRVTDIGTTFSVNTIPDGVMVSVAKGHVGVGRGDSDPVAVAAGRRFVASGGDAELRMIAATDVGSWRKGRLVYDRSPLKVVAADLSRYSGKTIVVAPDIRDRPFSGVLVVGDGSKLLKDLSALMALSYETHGNEIRLRARPDR